MNRANDKNTFDPSSLNAYSQLAETITDGLNKIGQTVGNTVINADQIKARLEQVKEYFRFENNAIVLDSMNNLVDKTKSSNIGFYLIMAVIIIGLMIIVSVKKK